MGRKIPLWQAFLSILFTIIALMYCLGVFGMIFGKAWACDYGEVHIALICSAIFASIIAILNGYKWSFLEAGILASINRSMQAILILAVVGCLIGSWIAAGVVPAMIYYGLMILKPSIFLFAGCILCLIVSIATGSSWTTAGTIGIALIGVGAGLGVNPAMTAGAVVSGGYFGDKMSPLSDTTNLAPAMAGSTLFDHIRHMVFTVTPSICIALVIYLILGFKVNNKEVDMSAVTEMQKALTDNFNINLWLLIPPCVVIAIVALKTPAIPGLIGGTALGCIFGSIFNGVTLAEWPNYLHYGFEFSDPDSVMPQIVDLLTRGGMNSMMWTINLILCAMCFGGVMDASGQLGAIAEVMLKIAKGTGGLVTATILTCIFMNIIAGDQYLSIVLPGRMYKTAFEDRKLAPKNLSRCLEDAGTITSCLVPWNTCGATMQTFLTVKTWGGPGGGYGRWAFLNWINPLVSIFYGFTGITMEKMTDEQYAKILEERKREQEEALEAAQA